MSGRHRWTIEGTGAWFGWLAAAAYPLGALLGALLCLAMLACSVIGFKVLQLPPW
jgi:hypothetical protein